MNSFVAFRNGKVKFMRIKAKTPVFEYAPATKLEIERVQWQKFRDDQVLLAPDKVKNFEQACKAWANIPTEKAYVSSAFQGIAIAMIFSFIVLMVVTGNPITSLSAIICVSIVITSLITFMYWNGQ